ncbi:MAG: hypothetical protein R6W89_04955 [Candidatus Hydrogenedentota bacterium]
MGVYGIPRRRFLGTTMASAAILGTAGKGWARAHAETGGSPAQFVTAEDREPHDVIAEAPAHSVVLFNRGHCLTFDNTLVIDKPLTVLGLNARMPEGLAQTPLVSIQAEGVRFADFELHGNTDSITNWRDDRASCLTIQAGGFVIERGLVTKASRHGVLVASGTDQNLGDYPAAGGQDIRNGVIRDIVARDIRRDGVSIEGRREGSISNLLVENIWLYRSPDRGAVEACDGADNITFRNIYAEDSVYAVDVQDHGDPSHRNRNLLGENIQAVRCSHAVRTANRDFGHTGLTLRNVTAERCELPLQISNTRGVLIDGMQVLNHEADGPLVELSNCKGVKVNDVMLLSGALGEDAIQLEGCSHVRVEECLDARADES